METETSIRIRKSDWTEAIRLLLELPIVRDDEPQVRPGGRSEDGSPLIRLTFPGHRSCRAARRFLQDLNVRVFEGKGGLRGPSGPEVPAGAAQACGQGNLAEIKAVKPGLKRPARPTGPTRGPWKGLDPDTRALMVGLADAARRHEMVRIYYRPKITTQRGGADFGRPTHVYRSVAPYSVRWRRVHVDGYDRPPRRVPVLFGYDMYKKSIKMFVADRIQNVTYIGRKFSPKWPVEWEEYYQGQPGRTVEKYLWAVDIPGIPIKKKTSASTKKQALIAAICWYEKNNPGVRVNRARYLADVDRYVRLVKGGQIQRELEFERLVDQLVRAEDISVPKKMYHSSWVDPSVVQKEGLVGGKGGGSTISGIWAIELGVLPKSVIYLSTNSKPYEIGQHVYEVDVRGLDLLPDYPSLIDTGAYLDEPRMSLFWEEGVPEILRDRSEDDEVPLDDIAAADTIELTGTATVRGPIPASRVRLFKRNSKEESDLDIDALADEMVTTGSIGSYEVPLGVPMHTYRKMLGVRKKKKKRRRRKENEAHTIEFEDIVVKEVDPEEATAKDMGYISPEGQVFVSDSLDHDNVGLALMDEFDLEMNAGESVSDAMARQGWMKWYGGLSPLRWAGAYGKRKDDPHRICMEVVAGVSERTAQRILAKMPQFSMVQIDIYTPPDTWDSVAGDAEVFIRYGIHGLKARRAEESANAV